MFVVIQYSDEKKLGISERVQSIDGPFDDWVDASKYADALDNRDGEDGMFAEVRELGKPEVYTI